MSDEIEKILNRGVENVYPSKEALKEVLESGKKLTIYLGIDPTGSTLHIGHGVALKKLRAFQDLGHKIILLIGDYTALIGDPTDKDKTRPVLTHEEIMKNSACFKKQASAILSFDGENPAELKYNGEWLSKLTFEETIRLASHFTVGQMIEREMFARRIKEGKPIHLHEFLYPLMQGYDSVAMDVDMEIGGNDQTFNMLSGRTLMKQMKNKEKFVLTTKLLIDPQGRKMGKSEGNMITLADSPEDMFGKVMSWPDGRMALGFELYTDLPMARIESRTLENPMETKKELARNIVETYHGKEKALSAMNFFETAHQKREIPKEAPEILIKGRKNLMDVLVSENFVSSKTEFRRLIDEGAIKVNGEKIIKYNYEPQNKDIVQIGKHRFYKMI